MNNSAKFPLFVLRLALGWVMLYAGITKIMNPDWTAGGALSNATFFSEFFARLAQPDLLPFVDLFNAWGLTLLGVSLILGAFVRVSAFLGGALMILYYLAFYDDAHSFYVEDHIIYALVLFMFFAIGAGRVWGLDKKISKSIPFVG